VTVRASMFDSNQDQLSDYQLDFPKTRKYNL
jgi:hypothetical protein